MSESSMKAFRALVWKELREASIPGAIAFVIVGAVQMYGMSPAQQFAALDSDGGPSLFTMASAGVALLIGGAQLYRERRGDMAAFLVHRPVPRAMLFWSKSIAGVAWYLIAAGLPLVGSYTWRAVLGKSATPFVASMMLPDIADLLAGLVYYFAALIVAMRAARWYASWVLPVVAAFGCTLLALFAGSFSGAVVRISVCLVVMLVAARSVFVADGLFEAQRRLGRMTLALNIAAGLALVCLFPVAALLEAVERTPVAPPVAPSASYTETALAGDGQVIRATWQTRPNVDGRTLVDIRALDGRPLDLLADSVRRWKRVDVGTIATADVPLERVGSYPQNSVRGYRGMADVLVPLIRDPRGGVTAWYYMRRLGLINVYANYVGQIGWMGPNGFTPGKTSPTHRFAGELEPYNLWLSTPNLIAFPDAVYRIDVDARTIRRIFTAAPGETVVGAASSGDSTATITDGPRAQFDVIATTRRIYVQSRDGTPQLSVARDSAAHGYGRVSVTRAMLAGGRDTYLTYSPLNGTLEPSVADTARTLFVGFHDDGRLAARAMSVREPSVAAAEPIQWPQIVIGALLEPVVWRNNIAITRYDSPAKQARRAEPAPRILGWVVSTVASIAWIVIMVLAGRRYAFSNGRMATWIMLTIALGPFAIVLMYALIDLPARRSCPVCGRKRVVTHARCEHCGSPFEPPPRDGTELIGEGVERSTLIVVR